MKNNPVKSKYIGLILSLVLCFGVVGCKQEQKMQSIDVDMSRNNLQAMDYNPALSEIKPIKPEPKQEEVIEEVQEETVLVNIGNFGRLDPFVPYKEKNLLMSDDLLNEVIKDIPSPPRELENDPNINAMMSARVAGILYDGEKSSAIINISNSDYFVHEGDVVNDFYIDEIKKDEVTIKYGLNKYKAGVGEIIEGQINNNSIHNLGEKFAGKEKDENIVNVNFIEDEPDGDELQSNEEENHIELIKSDKINMADLDIQEAVTAQPDEEVQEIEEIQDSNKKQDNPEDVVNQMRTKIDTSQNLNQ